MNVRKSQNGRRATVCLRRFYFDAVSAPQAGSFLLFAQKETNQRKGPPANLPN